MHKWETPKKFGLIFFLFYEWMIAKKGRDGGGLRTLSFDIFDGKKGEEWNPPIAEVSEMNFSDE